MVAAGMCPFVAPVGWLWVAVVALVVAVAVAAVAASVARMLEYVAAKFDKTEEI